MTAMARLAGLDPARADVSRSHECDRDCHRGRRDRVRRFQVRHGDRQRRLVAAAGGGFGAVPRRQGRGCALGRDRRALSIHAVRRLSVRRAMASGRRLCVVRDPVRGEHRGLCGIGVCCGSCSPPRLSRCCAAASFGLSDVPSEFWGGLPLTFLLSTVGFAVAFPLAIGLALGRRSELPAIRGLCIVYIELCAVCR